MYTAGKRYPYQAGSRAANLQYHAVLSGDELRDERTVT